MTAIKMNVNLYLCILALASVLISGCSSFGNRIENEEQLARIQDTWIRVLSNNPGNDNMRVDVSDSDGIIIDPANSGFRLNETKWQGISPQGESLYEYQELGSDGNYYAATMSLGTDDTLRISVGASGAGNVQKWVRISAYTSGSTGAIVNLANSWIRVKSNNPANDGMEVTVAGTQAEVTDNPKSSFPLGALKWINIAWSGGKNYNYDELGSDGNYYPSRMVLDGDTLRLTVDYNGSGNQQRWVKKDAFTPGGAETITLDCANISSSTTLTNGAAAVDYIVPSGCVLNVIAELQIEAGTVIEFEENSGLGVYDNGKLIVQGTSAEPVIMRGTESIKGWWRGIHLESALSSSIENAEISDAGRNYVYCCNPIATIYVKNPGNVSFRNMTLSNGDAAGIYIRTGAKITEYDNVTITTHNSYPLSIGFEITKDLDGNNSDYTGNSEDFVYVFGSNSSVDNEVKDLNVPYLFEGEVFDITKRLDVEAGTEIVFEAGGGWGVYDDGILSINGTSGSPVTMRGEQATRGYWRGIHVETNSLSNKIEYAVISEAGSNYVYCCNTIASLFLKEGKLKLSHTSLKNGANYGVYAGKNFEFNGYNDNSITTHTSSPMYIPANTAGALDSLNSSYTGNDDDYIRIYDSQVDEATSWHQNDVPYLFESVTDIIESLKIFQGTDMVFEANGGLGVYDNGSLYVSGRSGQLVKFRGLNNVSGYWRGIHSETNSAANVINYAEITNAGTNYVYCCNSIANLFLRDGIMTVTNSNITKGGGCGIFVRSGATLTESNNTFSDNTDGNICQ
ncbi:MAG: hypothetical protein AAFO96_01985 [Bacteroidota bacterium]